MRNNLHTYILEQVKDNVIKSLTSLHGEQKYTDQDLLRILFKNYRIKNGEHNGLLLTYFGHKALARVFDCYSYQINFQDKTKKIKKTKHSTLIALDKNMKWPYYIGKKYVTFFSEDDASWFRLSGSDINDFSGYV